jgi:hypothetical protein
MKATSAECSALRTPWTALGAEPRHATHRSTGEMLGAQSHDTVGHARGRARGMTNVLQRENYW